MAHESPQKVSQQFIWWLSKHPWRSFCKADQDVINRWHVKRRPNDREMSNGKDFMLQSPNWQQPRSEWLESPQKVSQQFIWWLSKHSWRSFCKADQDVINRWHVKRRPNDREISNGKDFMLQSPNWQQPQSEWLTNLRKKYLSSLFDGCQRILGAASAKKTRI